MQLRTDLALEIREQHPDCPGVECTERSLGDVTVTAMTVDEHAAGEMGRAPGRYVTVTLPPLTDHAFLPGQRYECLAGEISAMLPDDGTVLVVGLGNTDITPDALGPRAAGMIPATRHIMAELERSTGGAALRSCAVIAPGVLGQTGVEAVELIRSVCRAISPAAVIAIDALASRSLARLGCTVQISDAGIHPGSGVGNCRPAITRQELGVPVVAVGVPTVVDASTLAAELIGTDRPVKPGGRSMIVTPREVDLLVSRAAQLIALAVNSALHPTVEPTQLMEL